MRRFVGGAVGLICFLGMTSGAGAAPVVVGSPLVGLFGQTGGSGITATLVNLTIAAPGGTATSPVNGAIVRWHLLGAEGAPFRLRVLRPAGGTSYTAVGTSIGVSPATPGLETFPTALTVQAGDLIALDIVKGLKIGALPNPAAVIGAFDPILVEGATQALTVSSPGVELGFNAEVQPAPTITAVAPKSGSFKGRTKVTITGTDFAAVSGVSIGGAPVAFTVVSETKIKATAPRLPKPRKVDVTVTTVAGTSPLAKAASFTYTACVVPKLEQKTLKVAKKKLKKAGCKVGKVTTRGGATVKTGVVTEQGKPVGKKLAPGTKVSVTLS